MSYVLIHEKHVIKIYLWAKTLTHNNSTIIHDLIDDILTNLSIVNQYVIKIFIWAKTLTQSRFIISLLYKNTTCELCSNT